MNRQEYLLAVLAEECAEVAQRATKALRFTLEECEPDTGKEESTNAMRIMEEFMDLLATMEMLQEDGSLPTMSTVATRLRIQMKKTKVEKFMRYSKQLGTLR